MKKRFIIVLIIMVCLTAFSGGMLAHAQEKEASRPIYYKYYTTIEVESGDSLWEIADRYLCESCSSYDEYIQQIMEINGLKNEQIRAGEHLTVFYYSTDLK